MRKLVYKYSLLSALISCIYSAPASAQQILNLDFEKKSIEGIARPWGWDFVTYAETKVQLDSQVKHHGQYSLKMDAEANNGAQALSFNLEPYQLRNKTVTIEGWLKTNGLKGSASFSLNYITNTDTAETVIKTKPLSNSIGWTRLTATAKIPAKANSVNITVQQEGTGTAWFDNFSLSVDGRRKQQLEVISSFTSRQTVWLGNNSYPLQSFDASLPGAEPGDEDLAFFKSMAADARLIGLGESTHGTSEFFRLKHRVLQYSIQQLGVRIFAIEDHPLVVAKTNNYVMGGKGTARSAMYGMLGVWQTKEVHDMIEWMRDYNDLHPADKVEFTGFDIQNHSLAIDSVYSFIDNHWSSMSQPVHQLLDHLLQNGQNSYRVTDSVKLAWFNNATKVLEMISAQSASWLSQARNRQDSLSIYCGVRYANLIKQFAENTYRGHSSLYRDIAMAENVSWLVNVYRPGAKALLWAHDVHISQGEHPDSAMNIYFGKSMGAHLSKKFGAAYKSFGLFTYEGEYSCYVSYTNFTVTSCPLYVAPAGSLDEALHHIAIHKKTAALFLDLRRARSLDWLTRPVPVRFANHVNIEYGYWTSFSIPYQFDGIFFIDKTTAAKSYAGK